MSSEANQDRIEDAASKPTVDTPQTPASEAPHHIGVEDDYTSAYHPLPDGKRHLGLVLTGGGARAAYQVGVLRALARHFPELQVDILTGVSAGGINVSYLASHQGRFADAAFELGELWMSLTPDQVFRVDARSLLRRILSFNVRMILGGSRLAPQVRGMVDTRPLRSFLHRALDTADGSLPGIASNLVSGRLRAVALSTVEYATAQTVTWVQGHPSIPMWERTHRHSEACQLSLDHVMASAALPILFPATKINGSFYGDGGIRLAAPLSPALHLGADKILAISTRFRRKIGSRAQPATVGYPPPAQVAGVLMNAIFLDMLDQDVRRLERINRLLEENPTNADQLRLIDLAVLRPSVDLGRLAGEVELQLPRTFRWIASGFGTGETRSPDVLAMLMFQPDYVGRVIEVGEKDAEEQLDVLAELIES